MLLNQFGRDARGNVVPIFALAIVPVLGLVGASIDFSRAGAARTEMQGALDATALMLSKEPSGQSDTQLSTKADTYFKAIFKRPEAQGLHISATSNSAAGQGSTIVATATGTMPTTFTKLLGFHSMNFSTSSTIKWGSTKLRVALALDNTGSMALAGKMTALKSATKALLTQLQAAASTAGDVQVSIVPFAKDVNVGANKHAADWIDWSDWDAANGHFCKSNGNCSSTQNGNAVWTPYSHSTWNGCVTDRDKPEDARNTPASSGTPKTLFPAEQYNACPVAIQPLTTDWAALNALVDQMQPAGGTNQTIGLAWAWQTLSSGAPFNVPALPADTQQVIVLMSDGLNTQNRWDGNGSFVSRRGGHAHEEGLR
jgi:Flp pilus assembly protein TadG